MRYQACEDTMMIDISTIKSLELLQNIRNAKSKECLFGLLNETQTPMGSRLLRSNILQPSTKSDSILGPRYNALEELTTNEDVFFEIKKCTSFFILPCAWLILAALKGFRRLDIEKLLTKVSGSE
jgi:DNA mismatch repair protein MSH4